MVTYGGIAEQVAVELFYLSQVRRCCGYCGGGDGCGTGPVCGGRGCFCTEAIDGLATLPCC